MNNDLSIKKDLLSWMSVIYLTVSVGEECSGSTTQVPKIEWGFIFASALLHRY